MKTNYSLVCMRLVCFALLLFSIGANAVWADSYHENFSSTAGGYQLSALPEGWNVIGNVAAFERETEKFHDAKPAIAIHKNTENYLVSPKVAGTVSFYLRNYTKNYAAQAQIFACNEESDGTLTLGELLNETTLDKGNTQWSQVMLVLNAPTRVALLLSTAVIDDFSASELATQADTTSTPTPPVEEEKRLLSIESFERTCDYELTANDQNQYTASFQLVVKNVGNVALAPNEVSISVVDRDDNVVATLAATDSLPVQATATLQAEATIPAGEGGYVSFYARENLNGTYCQNSWGSNAYVNVHVTAFYAKFAIDGPDGYALDAGENIDFGYTNSEESRLFIIKNGGTAPLSVTGISLPTGFAASDSVFTVEAGGSRSLQLTLSAGTKDFGPKAGPVVVSHALGSFAFSVSGTTIDPTAYFLNFEDGMLPPAWMAEGGWSIGSGSNGNHFAKQQNYNDTTRLTTQKLTVAEGQSMTFMARRLYATTPACLMLFCSADGKEWTLLKDYGSLTSAFQKCTVGNVPAGDYYFCFYAQYVAIDNVLGFSPASNAPVLAVSNAAGQPLSSGTTTDLGIITADSTAVFSVSNVGTGLLSATFSAGQQLVVSPSAVQLQAGEQATIRITLAARPYGAKHDSLVISSQNAADFVLHFSANSRNPELIYADFQDQQWPSGWNAEGKWMVTWEHFGQENYWAEVVDHTNSLSALTTSQLRVARGDVLTLDAKRYDSYVPTLRLSYSTDRSHWTQVANLTAQLADTLAPISIGNLPQGVYYLRFEGSNVQIDNITGVRPAPATVPPVVASGNVADQWGQPVAGAVVSLQSQTGNEHCECVTDSNGQFSLVVAQSYFAYTLTASKDGYQDTTSVIGFDGADVAGISLVLKSLQPAGVRQLLLPEAATPATDLLGRPVRHQRRGLYIKNGKKIMMK